MNTHKQIHTAIRPATPADAESIAAVHRAVFARQRHSLLWITSSLAAYPRILVYVLEQENAIIGYTVWAQKSGFREQVVLELDQMAVCPEWQGKGLGRQLLRQSFAQVKAHLSSEGQGLKAVWVSTAADNPAQKLYREELGVQTAAVLEGLYREPEIIMLKSGL